MAKMKLREKMAVVAEKLGGTEVESRSSKFRKFEMPEGWYLPGFDLPFLFVGKAGSLRAGKNKTSSRVFSDRKVVKEILATL
jgi:hypothetical protein